MSEEDQWQLPEENVEEPLSETEAEEAPSAPSSEKPPAGGIENLGFLDLRGATVDDLSQITSIMNVGTLLISEQLGPALSRIPMKNVGSVIPLPEGVRFKMQMGEIHITGEALAAGDPEEILFVMGEMTITTVVREVGYREIKVMGEVTAPRGSEDALGPKLTLMGDVQYLPEGARSISGEVTLGRDFFEMLPDATTLVISGTVTIDDDTPAEVLRQKVPELIVTGTIHAPSELLSLLSALALRGTDHLSGRIIDKDLREQKWAERGQATQATNE